MPIETVLVFVLVLIYLVTRRRWAVVSALLIYCVPIPVGLWIWQFELPPSQRGHAGTAYTVNGVFLIVSAIAALIWAALRSKPWLTALLFGYAISLLLQTFAFLYWSEGAAPNFSQPLTHLDSLNFAIGTMATAGTGNLNATSESARRLQTVQMGLDFALVVFVASFVLSRYSRRERTA